MIPVHLHPLITTWQRPAIKVRTRPESPQVTRGPAARSRKGKQLSRGARKYGRAR